MSIFLHYQCFKISFITCNLVNKQRVNKQRMHVNYWISNYKVFISLLNLNISSLFAVILRSVFCFKVKISHHCCDCAVTPVFIVRQSVDTPKVPSTSPAWNLAENKDSTRGMQCLWMVRGDWSTVTGLQDDWSARRQVIYCRVHWQVLSRVSWLWEILAMSFLCLG